MELEFRGLSLCADPIVAHDGARTPVFGMGAWSPVISVKEGSIKTGGNSMFRDSGRPEPLAAMSATRA